MGLETKQAQTYVTSSDSTKHVLGSFTVNEGDTLYTDILVIATSDNGHAMSVRTNALYVFIGGVLTLIGDVKTAGIQDVVSKNWIVTAEVDTGPGNANQLNITGTGDGSTIRWALQGEWIQYSLGV